MSEAVTRTTSVSHEKYDRLIAAAQKETTIKVAVAHPCDEVSLRGVVEAANLRLVDPILVGPVERVRAVAAQSDLDIGAIEIVNSEHSEDSAVKAVELVTAGKVEALMKGSLHTDELMGAVVSRQSGIRTARRISHCFVMDVPGYSDALIISDAAVNIALDLGRQSRYRPEERNRSGPCNGFGRGARRNSKRDGDGDGQGALDDRGRRSLQDGETGPRSPARFSTVRSRSTTPLAPRLRRLKKIALPVAGRAQHAGGSRPRGLATCWRRVSRFSLTQTLRA